MDGIGFAMYKRNRRCVLGMNFTDAVKRYRYGKGKAACILLFIISFPCREEMLLAIRYAKVSVIPRRVLFCWTELFFPLDTEEKYVSAEIKGACGET